MTPLVIVPARNGSRGIPHKNFTPLVGRTPVQRAIEVVNLAGWTPVLSTDGDYSGTQMEEIHGDLVIVERALVLRRPPALAQDDMPMLAVIQHVLAQIPGPPDQPILLVQPTQVLREAKHLTEALALLTPEVDSVVSVAALPQTHSPELQVSFEVDATGAPCNLRPWLDLVVDTAWRHMPTTRQRATPGYLRDGTVYAFWRQTVAEYAQIYGARVRPLIIPASETCPLDTPADWAEAERRLKARAG